MRKTIRPRFQYKFVRAELWGNARDGFNTNDWWTLETIETTKELSNRYLLRSARDLFTGYSFAWSENTSRPMSREGIELVDYCTGNLEIHYRGHYVGEIQMTELCPQCSGLMSDDGQCAAYCTEARIGLLRVSQLEHIRQAGGDWYVYQARDLSCSGRLKFAKFDEGETIPACLDWNYALQGQLDLETGTCIHMPVVPGIHSLTILEG